MVEFLMPPVSTHTDGWGPSPDDATLQGVCDYVEHLDKFPLTRIGRICDFSTSGQRYAEQRIAKGKGKGKDKGKGLQALLPGKDEEGFTLVDTTQLHTKGSGRGGKGKFKGRGKGIAINYQEGILGQKQKPFFSSNMQSKGKGKGKGKGPRRGLPSFKEWSVQTKTEWNVKREINLSALVKLQVDARDVKHEDIMWCGRLHNYDRNFDRITAKLEKPMKRYEDLNFFNVSTSDDPILPELLQSDQSVTVIATDHVLACLCAAARSVYSWDIVVTKIANKLIFDKRDGSQIDFLTVDETANEPPNHDDPENINSPVKLGQEASCINQNFTQMVLDTKTEAQEMDNPNPFEDEEDGAVGASGAYRYRKITLPGNPKAESEFEQNEVSLIVRTEVNAKMEDSDSLVMVRAMHEYNPKVGTAWRTHIDKGQQGAILATELKNNAFKLGRWTAQAILAGCNTIKLGYVSRTQPRDPWSHSVLGVQTHVTDNFAEQIGLTRNNMFGIIRNIIDLIMTGEDGKYLLLKDPTKSMMRVYELPWNAFGEDDEEEQEEQEEEKELDEDGNERPQQPATVATER